MNIHAPAVTARLEQMFDDQASRTPTAPAVYFRGQVISYEALQACVDELARDLAAHGVGPGVLVALSLQRTPVLVAALLAILKAGGAYLPLDPRNPVERTQYMLDDSGCSVLLFDNASPSIPRFGGAALEVRSGRLIQRSGGSPPQIVASSDLAYVIYTSGSTGAPKGVMLGHGATHLVRWAQRAYAAEDRARVAATTSLSFDPSIFEIFVPLCTGGALILKHDALDPFTPDERPTMFGTAPSVLAELCRMEAIPNSLRVLNVGGEVLSRDLARHAYGLHPTMALDNHYGPTEATTVATVARIPRDIEGEPSIGRPVRGAEIVLLDGCGEPVPEGEPGEIHIGGPGLALGYLMRPDLTAARFIHGPTGRLYRTGDLARWQDGELHFAGRLDKQVKIRGFRIELGEVEQALRRVPGVEQALALVRPVAGRSQLVAYVQSKEALAPSAIRAALAAWLPEYMLPAPIMLLNQLPRLASGKLDYSALPEPEDSAAHVAVPASGTVKAIVHVFEEVLARGGVGPDDSFFELGGDSLASVQAALRLEEMLGYDLPAALIHQAPTARALARSLEHGRVRSDGHLSLLQPGGQAPPLFCMADLFGHPFNYLSLARRLAADRAVYGVAPGPLQAAFTKDGDLGRLTSSIVRELRQLRPQGPYLLAGYSAGGILAMDVACALEQEGETVALVLLDASLHAIRPPIGKILRWALAQARSALTLRAFRALAGLMADLLEKVVRRMSGGAPPAWIPASQAAFAARMMKVGSAYAPGGFSGPSLLVKAAERDAMDQLYDDGLMGWAGALKGFVVQAAAPGGHHAFMREPQVAKTAEAVSRFLSIHTLEQAPPADERGQYLPVGVGAAKRRNSSEVALSRGLRVGGAR